MSIKAHCGGLIIDNSTLKEVNQIITVSDGSPTGFVQSSCGVMFDKAYFKVVDGVVTDKDSTEAVSPITFPCGSLQLDSNCFAISNGALVFSDVPAMVSFKIDTELYEAEEGMTWAEWVASDYNEDGFKVADTNIVNSAETKNVCEITTPVLKTATITAKTYALVDVSAPSES